MIFAFYSQDIYLFIRTGCQINYSFNSYQDSVTCNKKVIVDGGFLDYKIIKNKLFISAVLVKYEYPKVCYMPEKIIYLYDSYQKRMTIFDNSQFGRLRKDYDLPDEFYQFPEGYDKYYQHECW